MRQGCVLRCLMLGLAWVANACGPAAGFPSPLVDEREGATKRVPHGPRGGARRTSSKPPSHRR
jgi:hypothetical protein